MRVTFASFTDAASTVSNPPAIYFESLDASRFEEPIVTRRALAGCSGAVPRVKQVLPNIQRLALVYGASAIEVARWEGSPRG